ncbi:hypothetical protein X733_33385 [Mesorhizobium sp. L2C067A000]|nr:hypothetical protein X733_33385 [Mesorhizobium sp. L2C067A000]
MLGICEAGERVCRPAETCDILGSEEVIEVSQSFARQWQRLSHVNVLSTIQLGRTTSLALSERLAISRTRPGSERLELLAGKIKGIENYG